MSERDDNLERLVSRYLDEECSDEERRQLRAMLRKDSDAASFLEEYVDIDREFNVALKQQMGMAPVRRRVASGWQRVWRIAGFGLAAAVAAVLWYSPSLRPQPTRASMADRQEANAGSWFAPPPSAGDVLVDDSARYERPQVRLDKDDRNWIVVPGEKPGEFMVIEVKRVKTRTIPLQDDL